MSFTEWSCEDKRLSPQNNNTAIHVWRATTRSSTLFCMNAWQTHSRTLPVLLMVLYGVSPTSAAQTAPDHQALIKSLRQAQARFERLRRQHLPWTYDSPGGRAETIGRFRYWHDEHRPRSPVNEPPAIGEARHRLLLSLDSGFALLPQDDWIVGQRVRYLAEADRHDDALQALVRCRATRWWCLALTGFLLHDRGTFGPADSVFSDALESMPDTLRCRWSDLSDVLDADVRREYRKLDCSERADFEERVWWLADPLLLVAGNDRRSEHFARRVYNHMLRGSASTFGIPWGNDNAEIVMRYGWPVTWERTRPAPASLDTRPTVIGRERSGGPLFLPSFVKDEDGNRYLHPASHTGSDRPRTRYSPAYAREFVPLDHQLATFRRKDSLLVVVAYALPEIETDTGHAAPYYGASLLGVSAEDDARPMVARGRAGRPLSLKAPRQRLLVVLETLSHRDSVAGRERFWMDFTTRIADGFAISDLLLLEPSHQPPTSLAQAIPRALPVPEVEAAGTIGLYWELYEAGGVDEGLQLALTVEKLNKNILREAAEALGVVGRSRDRIELRWADTDLPRGSPSPRWISLTVPDSPGRYRITVAATSDRAGRRETTRDIVIRQPVRPRQYTP